VIPFRADCIRVGYPGGPLIVEDVSVSLAAGRILVVLGPNGAGKSTLAKAMIGLLPLRGGRIFVGDADVTGQGPHKLVRRGVAYLPQLRNVFDSMSVIENLEMGGYTLRRGLRDRVEEVLSLFPDLAIDRQKRAGALSGGQQRMLALARVLMTNPVAAILDEPTAGLSPVYAEMVWEHLVKIRDLGVGMMVVEQNAAIAMAHADDVVLMSQGQVAASGVASEMRSSDEVVRILVGYGLVAWMSGEKRR
jgi:ABC-type branched-subunit amino acid transport system ATPase component